MPKELADNGYSGQVIAHKLNDQIAAIYAISDSLPDRSMVTEKDKQAVAANKSIIPVGTEEPVDVQIPGSNLSIQSLAHIIKKVVGFKQIKIEGEIISEDTALQITSRLSNCNYKTVIGRKDEINDILRTHAEHILKCLHPYTLARYYYMGKKYQQAVETISTILAQTPHSDDKFGYNLWGNILADQKNYQQAIIKYQEASKLDPENSIFVVNLGNTLYDLGKYDEAIAKYKQAVELNPNDANAYNNWGNAFFKLRKYEEATAKYKRAIDLDPNHAKGYNNWAVVLLRLGNFKEATAKCKRAIELDPDYANAHYNWGNALFNLSRFEEATAKYKRAIDLDPNDLKAYNNWGNALFKLKKYEEATAKYKRVIELNPDNADAYYNWGVVLEKQNNKRLALEKFKMAKSLSDKPD
ncbi:MAG: tetratricopeptide repeat protein [Cytophagales bacterium]|nr:tetratricopeptide repeat protein [Cytophagales bacterium]